MDINGYLDRDKPSLNLLIEYQLKKMQSPKVIMTLWVRMKKPVKLAVTLNPENAQDICNNIGCNKIRVEMHLTAL